MIVRLLRSACFWLSCAISSLALPAHASPELVSALNAARALGCSGHPGVATPLQLKPQLTRAAKNLADGLKLPDALAREDYRAIRTHNLWLSGPQGVRAVTDALVANYCAVLSEAALLDIGVWQQGAQTWLVLTTPFAPVAASQSADVAARVLQLVNAARAQPRICGTQAFPAAGPVKLSDTLGSVAMGHAADMAQNSYFSHIARDGSTPADRATRGGYRWRSVGENIAAGQPAPETAVEGWIKSPPHCATLMGAQYQDMGIAFSVNKASDAGIYWVQIFGTQQ